MGCDIHGFIEVKKYDFAVWYDCIDIHSIVHRNYDMFALLFGVRNSASFIPVAPNRGMPHRVSCRAMEEIEKWGRDGHSHSWITWEEIQAINWHEYGSRVADRIFCYRPGQTTAVASFGWSSELTREEIDLLDAGETLEKVSSTGQTFLYRREIQKVSDALSNDWQCLFDLMRCLDHYHRAEDRADESLIVESRPVPAIPEDDSKVRLVVWFDN